MQDPIRLDRCETGLDESHSDAMRIAAERLRQSLRVVVFTGAGVSAESGIPTFRDDEGFWSRFPVEEFGTWWGIARTGLFKTAELAGFLRAFLEPIANATPNAAHQAIALLGRHVATSVITQNVDGLHQEAGSAAVDEIHGSFFRLVDGAGKGCGTIDRNQLKGILRQLGELGQTMGVRQLLRALHPMLQVSAGAVVRPNVVLFGAALAEPDWTSAQNEIKRCDLLISVGTSGAVAPAAGLPERAVERGAFLIHIDPAVPPAHANAVWLQGPAGEVVPRLLRAAFG